MEIDSNRLGCNAKIRHKDLLKYVFNDGNISDSHDSGDIDSIKDACFSIDTILPFNNDEKLFIYSGLLHCINDVIVSGSSPKHGAISIGLDHTANESEHIKICSYIKEFFTEKNINLSKGHTYWSNGYQLTGSFIGEKKQPLSKLEKNSDYSIILTKKLGASYISGENSNNSALANDTLLMDHTSLFNIINNYFCEISTDISGYGLLGHLSILADNYSIGISLEINSIPFLDDYLNLFSSAGFSCSSLTNSNDFTNIIGLDKYNTTLIGTLYNGETNGPLTGFVKRIDAKKCLQLIKENGFPDATIIGTARTKENTCITI